MEEVKKRHLNKEEYGSVFADKVDKIYQKSTDCGNLNIPEIFAEKSIKGGK